MTCNENVCGTGGWDGPKPGDPDNNVVLSAAPIPGGIHVTWTYPPTNGHAVAHTILHRGSTSDFASSVNYRIVSGNYFIDQLQPDDKVQYFYWINVVSINGTVGDLIGPVSAVGGDYSDLVLKAIAGQITLNELSADLSSGIQDIPLLHQNLSQEILDRIAGNALLNDALNQVSSESDEALTFVHSRITEQATDTEALATSVSVLAAGLAEAQAAIVEEQTVRATEDEALASELQILYSDLADNQAAILNEQSARVTQLEAVATSLSGLTSQYQSNLAAVQAEQTARVNGDASLASSITSLQTQMGTNISALNSSISSIQTSLDGKASATQLNTLSTTVSGQTTSIQTNASSIDGIKAKYTVKVDNNGYITGFGLLSTANNGTPSSAFIIKADAFKVVMPGYGNYSPFSIGANNVIFNGNTQWDNLLGSGKPESNATKGATIGSNLFGSFNASNISVYMPNAVIGRAQIQDTAISSAKIGHGEILKVNIGDAQVDTLKIQGEAVTVPRSAYTAGSIGPSGLWTTVQTLAITGIDPSTPVICLAQCVIGAGGAYWDSELNCWLRILGPNGAEVSALNSLARGSGTCITLCGLGYGPGVYQLQASGFASQNGGYYSNRFLSLIGAKR